MVDKHIHVVPWPGPEGGYATLVQTGTWGRFRLFPTEEQALAEADALADMEQLHAFCREGLSPVPYGMKDVSEATVERLLAD